MAVYFARSFGLARYSRKLGLCSTYFTGSGESHLGFSSFTSRHSSKPLFRQNCCQAELSKCLMTGKCDSFSSIFSNRKLNFSVLNRSQESIESEFCKVNVGKCSANKFSTSLRSTSRYSKGPLETSYSQTQFDTAKDSKRRRSGNSLNNSVDFINVNNNELRETRLKIKKRVGKIRASLLNNYKIREKLLNQKAKTVFARRLKPLVVKKENIKTIPNLLTTLRMASAPVLSYLVINDHFGYAFSIFVFAGLTDLLDGYIARNFKNQRTAFGTALDPFADKLLISFLTISLTVCDLIPLPLTVLILSRDAGLVLASFYFRYISLSPPRTVARYFDFSHVTAKIYPSTISKINTGFQLSFVACTLAAPVFGFVDSPWLQLLMYTTGVTTFLSGADYLITWRKRLKFIKNN